ncbi:MAG: GldM family protein [Bacteroidota bacterium]
MSIPKEPRQLMINIMYLVLTALLALNVSAEVMNAFFTLDEGNTESINTVDAQLEATVDGVKKLLEEPAKRKFQAIGPAIDEVRSTVVDFNTYVDELRNELIDASGDGDGTVNAGDFKEGHSGELKYIRGKKNKDVTTRMLVEQGKGEELRAKVIETRDALIATYTQLLENNADSFGLDSEAVQGRIQSIANEMPFTIDDESWQESEDKNSWADYKFRQMPVAAVLPLLSQMQSNLKSSEAGMINSMAELTGGRIVEFDQFFPVVQADRSYVVGGESINAKISVGTYSSSLDPENVKVFVNGSSIPVGAGGVAEYTIRGSGTGQKTVPLRVEVTNPLTGDVSEGEGEFIYEVGARSVAVAADKMNVFYIGVENPITISASGVSSNDVTVTKSGPITISGRGSNRVVTASAPGQAKVNVSANGVSLGSFDFRIKRIPNPEARLSGKKDGSMGTGEFKAQGGVGAFLDDFDFDATCQVAGFNLVYVPKRQDAIPVQNRGARYNDAARRVVNQAKPGDIYYFENVRAKCPGDTATRKINSMVFKIQ